MPLGDDLSCFGCGKSYKREEDLSRHEQKCNEAQQSASNLDSLASAGSSKRKHPPVDNSSVLNPSKRPNVVSRGFPKQSVKPIQHTARRAGSVRKRLSKTGQPVATASGSGGPAFQLDDDDPMLAQENEASVPLSELLNDIVSRATASVTSGSADPILPPRKHRPPARYVQNDIPNDAEPVVPEPAALDDDPEPLSFVPRVVGSFLELAGNIRLRFNSFRTKVNVFGLSRLYYGRPDPARNGTTTGGSDSAACDSSPSYDPYPNWSAWRLGRWFHSSSSQKSKSDFKSLLDVLLSPEFCLDDIRGVPWDSIDNDLALSGELGNSFGRGWERSTVSIRVPTGQKSSAGNQRPGFASTAPPDASGRIFDIPGVFHRSIVSVMKNVLGGDPVSRFFHYIPFKQTWAPPMPGWPKENVFGELYSSRAFQLAHDALQALAPEPGCTLPRVVSAIMLGSDETHLAQFGHAKLWPLYLWFGNQSKYDRSKPSSGSLHPIAFFQKLPDTISEFIREVHSSTSKSRNTALHTHCKRELYHAILRLVLDDDFWHAYQHGIVITGPDGITRRHYPRLFTYSADYPEKVLLATIRDMGHCPCPRCLVRKDEVHKMGQAEDMKQRVDPDQKRRDTEERQRRVDEARHIIYELGYAVGSEKVDELLKDHSWVPTENAFSKHLENIELDIFELLVLDLMHEFELGVWKALFTHLIRMLHCLGEDAINSVNKRYREMPTFGRDTIRRFPASVSDLSKMTAHDFEELLLCSVPAFKGIFGDDECDEAVHDLLITMLKWHGLAKARLHTDSSVRILHNVTRQLGRSRRRFASKICPRFATQETKEEFAKRQRAAAARAAKTGEAVPALERKKKTFNLTTYKFHALGDYPHEIERIGTTDSWTSQHTELAHRQRKTDFESTNKRDFEGQLVKISNRRENLREMDFVHGLRVAEDIGMHDEAAIVGDVKEHHHIAPDESNRVVYGQWIASHLNRPGAPPDAAFEGFLDNMLKHFYGRLLQAAPTVAGLGPVEDEILRIRLQQSSIYQHARARFNYTTYDVRRGQDVINSNTAKRDVMLLADTADPSEHPFQYARVHGIFHAHVSHPLLSPEPTKLEFLWVRWFECTTPEEPAWTLSRLPKVRFVHITDDAFGFVDPAQVLRACHLMPGQAAGRTDDYIGPSIVREPEGDWAEFHVGVFVDRDMLFRYLGLGVGHVKNMPGAFLERRERPELDNDVDEMDENTPMAQGAVAGEEGNDEDGEGGEDGDEDEDEGDEESAEHGGQQVDS